MIKVMKESLGDYGKVEITNMYLKARFDDYDYYADNAERLLAEGIEEFLQSDFVDLDIRDVENILGVKFGYNDDEDYCIYDLLNCNYNDDDDYYSMYDLLTKISNAKVDCKIDRYSNYKNGDELEQQFSVTLIAPFDCTEINAVEKLFCYVTNGVEMVDDWVNNITINTYTKDGYALV